jgi:hypothetical protein
MAKWKFKLEKKELIFAFIGVVVLMGWFLYLKDLIAPFLNHLNPFFAMIIYNVGLFIGIFLMGSLLDGGMKKFKISIVGTLMFMGLDIMVAPYSVAESGIIATSVDYWYASTDAGFAALYSVIFPTSWLWFLTYIITPFLLVFIIPIVVFGSKQISEMIKKW